MAEIKLPERETYLDYDDEKEFNDTEEVEIPGGKFRLQTQKVILTYKHHLDKAKMREFVSERNKGDELVEFYIAHEKGDKKCPYLHTHVVVYWKKRIDTTNARHLDVKVQGENVHPHIRKIPNGKSKWDAVAWMRAVRYLGKEDPDNENLKTYEQERFEELTGGMKGLILKVQAAKSLTEALAFAKTASQIAGIKIAYEAKYEDEDTPHFDIDSWTPRNWQEELMLELKGWGGDRRVTWFYDQVGAAGKSKFTKWAMYELGKDCFAVDAVGRHADIAQNLVLAKKKQFTLRVIILDVSRSFRDRESLYGALESMRNGHITATKYIGGNVTFKCQHLVIFSNFLPKVTCMSMDRWDIRELKSTNKDKYVDSYEVEAINAYDLLATQGDTPVVETPTGYPADE